VQKAWTWLVSQRSIQGFADLQGADLMAYLETWQDRVAPGTVNHFLTSFWSFLRYVEAQNQPIAPGLYRVPRPKQSERLPRPLKEEAYQRLEQTVLEATAKGGLRSCLDRLCFFLMAHAGLRIGELQNLRLEDWHPAQQRLVVRQGKDNQDRAVPLSPETTAALEAYRLVREPVPLPHLLVYQGHPLGQNFIRNHLHLYADRAGLKGVTPHRLRHTCATRLLNAGMPVTSVQALLGHENLATTMGYAQLYDDTVRKDYQAALARLQGQSPTEESEPHGSPAPPVEPAASPSVLVTGPTMAATVVIGIVYVNVLPFATVANFM
jgi:site-specific recombinase XerD